MKEIIGDRENIKRKKHCLDAETGIWDTSKAP